MEPYTIESSLGQRVTNLRRAQDMTQRRLAEESGVKQSAVSQIERGVINPTVPSLFFISNALGVSLSELFEGVTSASGVSYD